MSFLDRIETCHRWQPDAYRPFRVGAVQFGRVHYGFARRLADFANVFEVADAGVRLSHRLDTFAARTEAVGEVVDAMYRAGDLPYWRGERYPVTHDWGEPPVMALERGAVPQFGVRAYGVHMNGIVERDDGLHIWVARRAMNRPVAPGKFDNMVAGGQPYGLSVRDNLIKECAEEAGIAPSLAATARPVGLLAYLCEQPDGLRDDIAFCYDLTLPDDFRPVNQDGEVAGFELWPAAQALSVVRDTDGFKFNCALVMIDLFVRHGLIGPDDTDYQAIVTGLSQGR